MDILVLDKAVVSILEIDSEDGSAVLVLDFSVAAGDSHEGVSSLLLGSLGSWDVFFQLLEELDGLGILVSEMIGALMFLDLSHFGVHIKGGLSDRDDSFNDVPEDSLVTWSGGQRALVGPSLVEVKLLDELGQIQVTHAFFTRPSLSLFFLDQFKHESVVPLNIGLRISDVHLGKVWFWHDLEEEAKDTSAKLGVLVLTLIVQEMDNVHFKVEELAVNGMFTWGMEVELDTVESGLWDMLVEEGDGLSAQAVGVLLLGLTLGNVEEESVTSLVEL